MDNGLCLQVSNPQSIVHNPHMSQRENIWAPWRMDYIRQLGALDTTAESPGSGCFLCQSADAKPGTSEAQARLVLLNDKRGQMLLNRYPYTNGHLLVAPRKHRGELSDLDDTSRAGLMELTDLAVRLLRAALNPQGINIGMNLGRCAGAGLPGHVHMHIVPRWSGDTNFMMVIGQVRVIPEALEESFLSLAQTLEKIEK